MMYAVQQGDIPGMGRIMRSLSEPFVENFDDAAYQHDFERGWATIPVLGG